MTPREDINSSLMRQGVNNYLKEIKSTRILDI